MCLAGLGLEIGKNARENKIYDVVNWTRSKIGMFFFLGGGGYPLQLTLRHNVNIFAYHYLLPFISQATLKLTSNFCLTFPHVSIVS